MKLFIRMIAIIRKDISPICLLLVIMPPSNLVSALEAALFAEEAFEKEQRMMLQQEGDVS